MRTPDKTWWSTQLATNDNSPDKTWWSTQLATNDNTHVTVEKHEHHYTWISFTAKRVCK